MSVSINNVFNLLYNKLYYVSVYNLREGAGFELKTVHSFKMFVNVTCYHILFFRRYLPMLPMYRSTEPQPGRQHTRPPHSAAATLSTRQAKRELELGET